MTPGRSRFRISIRLSGQPVSVQLPHTALLAHGTFGLVQAAFIVTVLIIGHCRPHGDNGDGYRSRSLTWICLERHHGHLPSLAEFSLCT
jgi:hypothetical protein